MQTIFPELKMRAVVRGSLILMITAANLYKFKGGPDRNLAVFLFSVTTINTSKACHNTYLLFKCFFTTPKVIFHPPRNRRVKTTVRTTGILQHREREVKVKLWVQDLPLGYTLHFWHAELCSSDPVYKPSLQLTQYSWGTREEFSHCKTQPLQSHPPAVLA